MQKKGRKVNRDVLLIQNVGFSFLGREWCFRTEGVWARKGKVRALPATEGTYPGLGISESRNVLAAKPNSLQPTT